MKKRDVLEQIKREKLIPVIRTDDTNDARKAIQILSECGIKVFEIMMTVPNAVELIAEFGGAGEGVVDQFTDQTKPAPGARLRQGSWPVGDRGCDRHRNSSRLWSK